MRHRQLERRRQLEEDLAGRFEEGKRLYPKVPPNVRGVLWRNSRNGKYFIWLMREWLRAALATKGLTFDEEQDLAYHFINFVEDWDKRKFPRDIYQLSFEQAREVFRARRRTRPVPLTGEGTKLILDTDDFALIRYETRRAACFYGKGTKWCISSRESTHWWWNYRLDGWRVYLILNKALPSGHPFYKVTLMLRWKTHEPPVVEGDWINAVNKKTTPDELALSGYTREDVARINLEATRDFRGLQPPSDVEAFETFKQLREEVHEALRHTPEDFAEMFERLRPMRDAFAVQFARAVASMPMEPLHPNFSALFRYREFWVLADADSRIWQTIAPHKTAMLTLAQSVGAEQHVGDEYFLFIFGRGAFSWGLRSIDTKTGLLHLEKNLPYLFDSAVNARFRKAESDFPKNEALRLTAARLQLVLFALHGYLFGKDKRHHAMTARFLEPDVRDGVDVVARRIDASVADAKAQVQARLAKRELSEREEMEFLTPSQMSYFAHKGSQIIEDVNMDSYRTRLTLAWLRAHVPKPPED